MPEGEVRVSTKKEPATLKTATGKGEYAAGTKTLHHIVLTPTESATRGGPPGFVLEHHYKHSGGIGEYNEPEEHAFSPGSHAKMIKHLKKHLGLAPSDATEEAVNEEDE